MLPAGGPKLHGRLCLPTVEIMNKMAQARPRLGHYVIMSTAAKSTADPVARLKRGRGRRSNKHTRTHSLPFVLYTYGASLAGVAALACRGRTKKN